jgi:hypothetical protein
MAPEQFEPKVFLDLMSTAYKQPWGMQDRNPENPSVIDDDWED